MRCREGRFQDKVKAPDCVPEYPAGGRREMYVVTGGETKGRLRPITGRGLFLFRGRFLSGNKRSLLPVQIIGKYEKDNMESMTWKTQHGKYDMENTTWKV